MAVVPLTLAQAQAYVLKTAGMQADPNTPGSALDSIAAATEEFNGAHPWAFLLEEIYLALGSTSLTGTITNAATGSQAVAAYTAGTFATGTFAFLEDECVALGTPADTTHVNILKRGCKGTIAVAHAAGTPLTQRDYALPTDFNYPFTPARLVGQKRTVELTDFRDADVSTGGSLTPGIPVNFAIFTDTQWTSDTPLTLTTLNAAMADTTGTAWTVVSAARLSLGQVVLIDTEQVRISAITSATTFASVGGRGYNGSTAATHINGSAVQTTGLGQGAALRLYAPPATFLVGATATADTLALRYHRRMNPAGDGTNLDCAAVHAYHLLDWAAAHLVTRRNGNDPRAGGLWDIAKAGLQASIDADSRLLLSR